jgi:hypothetical protein
MSLPLCKNYWKTKVVLVSFMVLMQLGNKAFCKSNNVSIVSEDKSGTIIIIPDIPTDQVQSAAITLSFYINKATNVQLPIITETDASEQKSNVKIWVGQTNFVLKQNNKINASSDDSFSILFPDDQDIIITGKSDWGTEFGVYEFLEHYVGVKWLIPGPSGESVPTLKELKINMREIIQEPAFFSRSFSGLKGKAQSTWARKNRMHTQIKFHHNLLNLFPVEKYRITHPEFYPLLNGKRYLPSDNNDHKWQSCFSAQGSVDEAIKNICDYFATNPDEQSYSLGINDSHLFCQCDKCMAKVGNKKNYLNLPNYSELYYNWANKVVEGVLKKYPDKWFGCLAHVEVAEPPTFKLNPRIVPFITYDRLKWVDQNNENKGKEITERWAKQSSGIGWYDYIYGTPYLVPRVYFHKMADYYKYAQQHGVKAMYAEAYPNWGEGPKLYIALKLQWNPSLDVDSLLEEWYIATVGEKASKDLASYYGIWEDFWTNRIKKSEWFTSNETYLRFSRDAYLDLVTYDDIEKSRRLLEAVLAKTETPEQKERANLILRAFEYYEASVSAYLGLVKREYQPGKNEEYYKKMNQLRYDLVNEFEKDPVLIHPCRFDKKGILNFQ